MVEFRIDAIVDPSAALRGAAAVEKGLLSAQIAGAGLTKTIHQAFAAIGVGVGVRELVTTADTFINLENRLRTVIAAEEDLVRVEGQLFDISQQTRTSYQANVEVFQRFTSATASLHTTQTELLNVIENLDKAVALSGATAIEASNALRQLTQGLGSGALKGDELRSVLEQLPTVADIIAKKLDTTRGGLKKFGEQGKITTQVIISAFEQAGPQLDAAFKRLTPTIGQSLITLGNSFLRLIGEINKGTGVFGALGTAIRILANNLGNILTAAVTLSGLKLVTVFGGALAGLVKQTAAATPVVLGLSAAQEFIALHSGNAAAAVAKGESAIVRFANAVAGSTLFLQALGVTIIGTLKVAFDALNEEANTTAKELDEISAEGRSLHSVGDQISSVERELRKLQARGQQTDSVTDRIAQLTERLKDLDAVAKRRTTLGISPEDEASIKKAVDRMNEEIKVAQAFGKESEALSIIEKELNHVREKNKNISEEGIAVLREQLDFTAHYLVELRIMQGVINGIVEPQERFSLTTLALNEAMRKGFITAAQYKDRVAAARAEFEKSKKPQDPFRQETDTLLQQQAVLKLNVDGLHDKAAALEEIQALENQGRNLSPVEKLAIEVLNQQNAALQRQATILEDLLGPQRQLKLTQQDLNALYKQGKIDAEQYGVETDLAFIKAEESSRRFADGLDRGLRKLRVESQDFASAAEAAVNVFADDATNALVQFAETGKFAFKDFARSLISDLTRIVARLLVVQALSALLGAGPTPPVGGASAGQVLIPPGRAGGGPVTSGRSYLVGEHGPELFTPSGSGNITSAPATASGGAQVNLQVVNVDDPNHVPAAINRGGSDQAILNVLARNKDRVNRVLS